MTTRDRDRTAPVNDARLTEADVRYGRAVATLRALGIVANLRLLVLMSGGPRSVADLANATGKAEYLVLRRLARLTKAGLVTNSRTGYFLGGAHSRHLITLALART